MTRPTPHLQTRFPLMPRRIVAFLVDVLLLFLVLAPLDTVLELLLGIRPGSATEVWLITIAGFSLPTWLYFVLSDHSRSGATLGKRLLGLRVTALSGERLSFACALLRTAIKLIPWETAHLFAFLLAGRVSGGLQSAGLIAANVLGLLALASAAASHGRRSLHDLAAGSHVSVRRL